MKIWLAALVCVPLLLACSPEVGSQRWCEAMKEKPKGDWTASETGEFAKNCVLPSGDE